MDKTYQLYGLGNALVDMEFEVAEDFVRQHQLKKGVMSLVDEDRQSALLKEVGHLHHKKTCGGSAANTVMAFSQLGGKAFYSCKVASDALGEFYYSDLKGQGVSSNLEKGLGEGVTGKCMVFITPDAERTMETFLGITSTFSKAELVEEKIRQSEYLYIEGYLTASPTGLEAALEAKKIALQSGVKTALTFSDPTILEIFRGQFEQILGAEGVDLLFCNEREALSFAQTEDLEVAFNKIKTVAKNFCLTRSEKGAWIFDGQKKIEVAAPRVKAIDANGAGDLFAGAFIYGLTHGKGHHFSGKLACELSSKLVTQYGARLRAQQTREIFQRLTANS